MTASSSVRRGTRQRYVPAWVYPLWVQTASHPCRCACCHPTCIPCRRKSLVYSFVNAVDLFEPRQCFRVIHPRLIKCFFTVDVVAVIKIIQFVVSHRYLLVLSGVRKPRPADSFVQQTGAIGGAVRTLRGQTQ